MINQFFIYCFLLPKLCVWFCVGLFLGLVRCVLPSFAIIILSKRELISSLVALLQYALAVM